MPRERVRTERAAGRWRSAHGAHGLRAVGRLELGQDVGKVAEGNSEEAHLTVLQRERRGSPRWAHTGSKVRAE